MRDLIVLELYRIAIGQMWSLIQWWASVSFGLVALGHFAGKKLNFVFVVLLVVLYTSFTAFTWGIIVTVVLETRGYRDELTLLRDDGELGPAGIAFLDSYGGNLVGNIGGSIAVLGAYLGAIFYLVYAYRKSRPQPNT